MPIPFDIPPQAPAGASRAEVAAAFDRRAGWVVRRLLAEPGLGLVNPIHPSAILGNMGGESGLDPDINEAVPQVPGSRGGFGWEQATGPRRLALEKWAKDHGFDFDNDPEMDEDEANYGFLVHELLTTENHALQQLKETTTLEAAVETFEILFERPSDPQGGLPSRIAFAKRALAAASRGTPVPAPEPTPDPSPTPAPAQVLEQDPDNALIDSLLRGLQNANATRQDVTSALQAALALDGLYDGKIDGIPGPKTDQAISDYRAQRG